MATQKQEGTRQQFRKWLKEQAGMTYSHYANMRTEAKAVLWGKYSRNERMNVLEQPVTAKPVAE